MKGIKKILFILLLFFIVPIYTNAATKLSASSQKPVVGSTIYIQINIDYGKELLIQEAHYQISYSGYYYKLEEVIWTQSAGTWSNDTTTDDYGNEKNAVNIDKLGGEPWEYGGQVQLKFTVINTGSCSNNTCMIGIKETSPAYFTTGDIISQTTSGVTVVPVAASDYTTLKELYVAGYVISPTFNKNVLNYNLKVDSDVQEVTIVATKGDKKQEITGDGVKKLSYGDNRAIITVTAEDGSQRIYQIMINRKDDRTGDVSLKSLSGTNTDLKYEEGKTEYYTTVSRSITETRIFARTSDENATLIGTGLKQLEIGMNTFQLTVTSSGGSQQVYTIHVIRSEEEIQQDIESSKLLSLSINSLVFDMNSDKTSFIYGVGKEYDELNISAVPLSKTAEVKIEGNKKLKSGFNNIKITVTEKNGEITEYKIVAYKNPSTATVITNLNEINNPEQIQLITSTENESHIISKDLVKSIKNYDKTLYYNVVNVYNGILYQAKINNNIEEQELDLTFKQLSTSQLTYETKMPKGIEVTLFVGEKIKDETIIKVYGYNEIGKYNLITEGVKVIDGYITFTTSDYTNYVFTTSNLINVVKKDNTKTILIAIVAIIVVLIIITSIKKKEKIDESEPLY